MSTAENDTKAQAAAILEQQLEATYPNFDADMRRSLASMGASIATRKPEEAAEVKATPEKLPAAAKILQFPLPFGDDTRASSNLMARCALFAPVNERAHFKDYAVVGNVDGYLIEWKGEQLNQDDHDTLLQLIKMALHKPFGVDVVQSVNAVLKGLGRQTRQTQRQQFFREVDRLMSGTIRVTPKGGASYGGHLINDIVTPQDQQTEPQFKRFFSYQLNPKLAKHYENSAYTLIDWQDRVKLKGRGGEFAKWLQLFIESHAQQYPHRVETIRQLCGSNDKTLKSFRQKLRQSLDLLKEAGIIAAWQIDPQSDLVTIERTPSESQQKYITKKASRKPRK